MRLLYQTDPPARTRPEARCVDERRETRAGPRSEACRDRSPQPRGRGPLSRATAPAAAKNRSCHATQSRVDACRRALEASASAPPRRSATTRARDVLRRERRVELVASVAARAQARALRRVRRHPEASVNDPVVLLPVEEEIARARRSPRAEPPGPHPRRAGAEPCCVSPSVTGDDRRLRRSDSISWRAWSRSTPRGWDGPPGMSRWG